MASGEQHGADAWNSGLCRCGRCQSAHIASKRHMAQLIRQARKSGFVPGDGWMGPTVTIRPVPVTGR